MLASNQGRVKFVWRVILPVRTSAFAFAHVLENFVNVCPPICVAGEQGPESAKRASAGGGVNEGRNFSAGPCGQLRALDGVFRYLANKLAFDFLDVNDRKSLTDQSTPSDRKLALVDVWRVHEGVKMEMPALSLVGDFQRPASTSPIPTPALASKFAERSLAVLNHLAGYLRRVAHGQDNMFRLLDEGCPPFNCFLALPRESWLTDGTEELITTVPE